MPSSKAASRELIESAPLSESLRALARAGDVRRYAKGTLLISEGERGDSLYIILSGRLRAFSVHELSEREITYGIYDPGEYVGEMSLDGGERSASVITLVPSVCSRIERATLQAHIAADPPFAFELLAKVIRRARAATVGFKQIALNDVYGRLKLLLESLAQVQADGARRVPELLTHREIAQRLGCGREMVSRLMKDLERGGYIRSDAHRIVVVRILPPRW